MIHYKRKKYIISRGKRGMGDTMKKNDLILFAAIILLSLALFAGYRLFFYQSGDSVRITVDGAVYKTLPLEKDATLDIPGTDGGTNHLEIKNGAAGITDADCPDKLCVHQKKIKNKGETLICLPHKVVVEVYSKQKNASEPELDGIAN